MVIQECNFEWGEVCLEVSFNENCADGLNTSVVRIPQVVIYESWVEDELWYKIQ